MAFIRRLLYTGSSNSRPPPCPACGSLISCFLQHISDTFVRFGWSFSLTLFRSVCCRRLWLSTALLVGPTPLHDVFFPAIAAPQIPYAATSLVLHAGGYSCAHSVVHQPLLTAPISQWSYFTQLATVRASCCLQLLLMAKCSRSPRSLPNSCYS